MNLTHAQRCADKLMTWLLPFCERIQTAGSIRRGRPQCGDIDLVILPKLEVKRDLLGSILSQANLCRDEIVRRAMVEKEWTMDKGFDTAMPGYLVFTARGIQVDVWFATEANWGSVLMTRTGSKEHNIWLVDVAKRKGGIWSPKDGVTMGLSRTAIGHSEEAIYSAIGLPFIEPADREIEKLRKIA